MSFNQKQMSTSTHPIKPFDFGHDTITTMSFGEVQPISCRLLPTVGKHSISTEQLIRLNSLCRPTFGRIWYHQYHQFCAIEDVFWQFPHFLARIKALNDPNSGSINYCSLLPSVTTNTLAEMLYRRGMCHITCYVRPHNTTTADWEPCASGGDKGMNSTIPHFKAGAGQEQFPVGSATWWMDSVTDPTSPYFVTPESADFQNIRFNLGGDGEDYRMCIKLTKKGARWLKLLTGLGYKVTFGDGDNLKVSLIPLMCAYKAYWDIFHLDQYDNYEETALYRLSKFFDINGVYTLDVSQSTEPDALDLKYWDILHDFFDECLDMFYTANQDFVSAHYNCSEGANTIPYEVGATHLSEAYTRFGMPPESEIMYKNAHNGTIGINTQSNSFDFLYQLDIELLKKYYYWSNKKTACANNIRAVLEAKGLGQFCDECAKDTNFIGNTRDMITIQELLSTSDTADSGGRELGDYAGQSSQYANGKKFHYTNNKIGYIISFGVIVPEPRQSSAMDPTLLGISDGSVAGRIEFYNPMFDGFGYEATPLACIGKDKAYTNCNNTSDNNNEHQVFGVVPRYTGHKVAQNIRNGMFGLLGSVNAFSPFHLDKLIITDYYSKTPQVGADGKFKDEVHSTNRDVFPLAGRSWRFPTRTSGVGNYDRIFYDGQINPHSLGAVWDETLSFANDNFMIFECYHHDAQLHMLPISRSWDTMDEDQENNGDGLMSVRN